LELSYYQQFQTHPWLESAKEKGFRAMWSEDQGLVSILEPGSIP